MFWFFGHEACGILGHQPGIESGPPALGAWSLNHWTTREVPQIIFKYECTLHFDNSHVRKVFLAPFTEEKSEVQRNQISCTAGK